MSSDSLPARSSTPAAVTATTLVALVAMAASISVSPHARNVTVDYRAVMTEGPAVRTMAAVVAAAARSMLAKDHVEAALPCPLRVGWMLPSAAVDTLECVGRLHGPGIELREALLALPPPIC